MYNPYCNNCGKTDHTFKNCPDPITSYGLICMNYNSNNIKSIKGKSRRRLLKKIDGSIKYLMIMKRNSFTYIEFMRAKYDLLDPDYIQTLFNHMTMYERELVLKNKFNYLWNNLWNIKKHGMTNPKNKSDFYKGIIKFNILQNGFYNQKTGKHYSMKYFIDNSTKNYKYPEWYFPKGRKNQYESNINCAKREFIEETDINYGEFKVLHDIEKYEETHKGTNDVNYRTVFYAARYDKDNLQVFNSKNKNKFQKQEIGDVKWMTINEMLPMFREYEQTKINMIKKLHKNMVNDIYNNNHNNK